MPESSGVPPSFFARVAMAFVFFFRILFKPPFAQQLLPYRRPQGSLPPETPKPPSEPALSPTIPAEKLHASGLFVLSMLQREGRFIDFLQEDVAGFSDAEV